jgi:hypothetical protein
VPGSSVGTAEWGTDNTTAITNAVAAANAEGGGITNPTGAILYLPYGGTGNYYVSGSISIASSGISPQGLKLIGECGAPLGAYSPGYGNSGGNVWGPVTCSTLVADQAIIILTVGNSAAGNSAVKFHSGLLIENIGFRDVSVNGGQVIGGIALYDTEDFNLTNVRVDGMSMLTTNSACTSGTTPCGYGILFDGTAGTDNNHVGAFTQFGVINNPSIFNTRFPILTNNQTSEINIYGGSLICALANTPSVGIDLGHSFNHANLPTGGEWGIYGTHILNCPTAAVWLFNNNVLQFYGIAEQATSSAFQHVGTGIVVDGDSPAQTPGGEYIAGSLNNFDIGIDIKPTPINNIIVGSVTNNNTEGVLLEGSSSSNTKILGTLGTSNGTPLTASGLPLSSSLILTNNDFPLPSSTGVGSQIPTDLTFSTPETAGTTVLKPPTGRTLYSNASSNNDLTVLKPDGSTVDLESQLLSFQGPAGTITGNSTPQTVYTFTLPPIPAGKGVRARVYWTCTTCHTSSTKTFDWQFGTSSPTTVTYAGYTANSAASSNSEILIFNTTAQTNQTLYPGPLIVGGTGQAGASITAATQNTANSQALTFQFAASPSGEVITPGAFIVEAIQ